MHRPGLPPHLYKPIHQFWRGVFEQFATVGKLKRPEIAARYIEKWDGLKDELCPEEER